MKYNFLWVLWVGFSCLIHAQTHLKSPTLKPKLYDTLDRTYFPHWESKLRILNEVVYNPQSHTFIEVKDAYYNRFITYYKMLPDDLNDILYIFMDALLYDKDDFCSKYHSTMKELSFNMDTYYKKQKPMMDKMCECVLESYNKKLIARLNTMADNDQKYRNQEPFDWKKQRVLDSINVKEALLIYDQYGLPDRRLVGVENESIFFFIIQHSNLELMERFLPEIKQATELRRLSPTLYPYMYDRICMIKGKPQEFGTQFQFNEKMKRNEMYKTIKLEQVNINRKKYGLKEL